MSCECVMGWLCSAYRVCELDSNLECIYSLSDHVETLSIEEERRFFYFYVVIDLEEGRWGGGCLQLNFFKIDYD